MMEYQEHLECFSVPATREETKSFLEQFWLNWDEYVGAWLPVERQIFRCDATLFPDLMFQERFQLVPLKGGVIFTEEDFGLLQRCMIEMGNKEFVIVQNPDSCSDTYYTSQKLSKRDPILRFKFPVNVSWDVLMSGGHLSDELFVFPRPEYFVYADSGTWGKYVANEFVDALDIIGFEESYSPIFEQHFKTLIEPDIVRTSLPHSYQGHLAPWIRSMLH